MEFFFFFFVRKCCLSLILCEKLLFIHIKGKKVYGQTLGDLKIIGRDVAILARAPKTDVPEHTITLGVVSKAANR